MGWEPKDTHIRMEATVKQSVLVTGASGFIGGHLVRRLIERHYRVFCLVRSSSRIDELRSAGAQLVNGDVTDRASVVRSLAESQAGMVFHLAGLVKARSRDDFMSVNAGGVAVVAAACADRAGPPVLVVVSSLSAVGPCAPDAMRTEGDISAPVSNYGRSKLAGEEAAIQYAGAVPISIVRPPIVFGPGDQGVLEMFRPIARWGLHVVPGRGRSRCSLLYVDDLVEGLLLVAEKGERVSQHASPGGQGIYFFAEEDRPTYTQLGQSIAAALGKKPPVVMHLPRPLARFVGVSGDVMGWLRRRPAWVNGDKITEALAGSWICSPAKARAQLGWSPGAALADRLRETAQWYRQAGWL
jgi:nucleoside-diphosphate-sugar epimerase